MPVLNDEVPDEGDFDAGRRRGEFDDITPEDFIRGSAGGNPPGWLDSACVEQVRRQVPMVYVEVVPVHTDEFGRIAEIGTLLRVSDDGSVERTLVAGRVLYHESLREAIARNVAKDLGPLALPTPAAQPAAVHGGGVLPHPRAERVLRRPPACGGAVLCGADRRRLPSRRMRRWTWNGWM